MIRNTAINPSPLLPTFDLDALNLSTYADQAVSASSLDLTFSDESTSPLLRRLPVPACNGLLLVQNLTSSGSLQNLEIWNPSTHERLQLPPIGFTQPGRVFIGLGYDDAAQDFMDVLGGCLAVSGYSHDPQLFHVWVMKGYGSDDEAWTKLLTINRAGLDDLRPVAHVKDKNQVFLQNCGSDFFLFDVESKTMKTVRIHGLAGNSSAQTIPQTMFRLRRLCGAGASGTSRIKSLGPRRKAMKVSLTIKNL